MAPSDFPWRPRMRATLGDEPVIVLAITVGSDALNQTPTRIVLWRERRRAEAVVDSDWLAPDLTDGPTKGALLEAVREAWGDPYMLCAPSVGFDLIPTTWAVIDRDGRRVTPLCPTEGDALLAAWDARPR